MSKLIVNEELQTLYFDHADTVATTEGVILTTNFDAEHIKTIRSIIFNDNGLLDGEFCGQLLPVKKVDESEISKLLAEYTLDLNNFNGNNEQADSLSAQTLVKYLQRAVDQKASDVHFEVYRNSTRVLARVDGLRRLVTEIPNQATGMGMISYLLLSGHAKDKDADFVAEDINNANLEQELDVETSGEDGSKSIIRRNTIWRLGYIPSPEGGKMTLRWLNRFQSIPTLEDLNYEPAHIEEIKRFISYPSGVMLMGGVTGSGKTTTLAATVSMIDTIEKAIHTLEDPIEFKLSGVVQTLIRPNYNINSKSPLKQTQAQLSKALLRHDTDGELHSEIRDHEAGIEVSAKGETGQLIFSTIHVSSAVGTAPRLIEMMKIPKELVTAPNLMRLWVYQSLVRKLCPHCSMSGEDVLANMDGQEDSELAELLVYLKDLRAGVFPNVRVRNPGGCEHCHHGEKDRLPLVEMIILDNEDREYILNQDYIGWSKHLHSKGYKTVKDHAITRIFRGEVDPITVNNILTEKIKPVASADIYRHINECMEVAANA